MTVEELLVDALHSADDYPPSPDLFAKVQRSITEDAAHRHRLRRIILRSLTGLLAAAAWVAAFLDFGDGVATMPWWTVEALTTAILITLTVVLGPLIRRFGIVLTDDVFRSNPPTSLRFLAVLDVAYYLVFFAYVLMSASFAPDPGAGAGLAGQAESSVVRIAGLLMTMGILHAVTIGVLPVLGMVFASNWRRAVRAELGIDAPEPELRAEKADRIVRIITWAVAALAAFQALSFLLGPGLFGLILGAD